MEHPTYEELLALLDKGGSTNSVKVLKRHVEDCPECKAELAAWQRTVRRLEGYGWPTFEEIRPVLAKMVLKWSAAVVILIGIGFGFGRLLQPSADDFRQMIAMQVKQQVEAERHRLVQDAVQLLQRKQDENQRAVLAILNKLREKHEADYLSLRQDLETAASVADGDLQRNQQQLNVLAAAVLVKDR